MKTINISGSYVQDQKHANVSDRFNVIQPSMVGQAMANQGLSLVSLSTGRGRHPDKIDFQRTLSRYRGPEIAPGVNLDLIYSSKHMGRGVDQVLLGIYRMICTNGLYVGKNFFAQSVRHSGNTYDSLNDAVGNALDMSAKLTQLIQKMQSFVLSTDQSEALAREAVRLLVPSEALQVKHRLLTVKREADKAPDLWTVFNVIQENAIQGRNIGYTLSGVDANGVQSVRAMTTRHIRPNTGKDADFNSAFFDIASKLVA